MDPKSTIDAEMPHSYQEKKKRKRKKKEQVFSIIIAAIPSCLIFSC